MDANALHPVVHRHHTHSPLSNTQLPTPSDTHQHTHTHKRSYTPGHGGVWQGWWCIPSLPSTLPAPKPAQCQSRPAERDSRSDLVCWLSTFAHRSPKHHK
eukprot:scaffold35979_cov18-Tisochrysis_lutea.AAC.2